MKIGQMLHMPFLMKGNWKHISLGIHRGEDLELIVEGKVVERAKDHLVSCHLFSNTRFYFGW